MAHEELVVHHAGRLVLLARIQALLGTGEVRAAIGEGVRAERHACAIRRYAI